jgi:PIN domain nuclease of toxin-antitoxin system
MNLLLDTHALLWALSSPGKLPARAKNAIVDPSNDVVASAVSAWEIALKQSLGKLELPAPAERWLPVEVHEAGFGWIPVTHEDGLRVRVLEWHHRDPFDRLLIAQSLSGYTLVTHDQRIWEYGVPVLWK